MLKKGLVIATAVASAMLLAGCASQGSSSACGEPTAVPVAAPAPAMNTCKNMSSCKHKMMKKHHHHHAKKMMSEKAAAPATDAATGSK